jgi:formamidopyrimidine-DNA glycosylase
MCRCSESSTPSHHTSTADIESGHTSLIVGLHRAIKEAIMPELPEITILSGQMKKELPGRVLTAIDVLQPKCLNMPEDDFRAALVDATIQDVGHRGKWITTRTDRGWLLLNLGMGGEIWLVRRDALPEKHRLVFHLDGDDSLSVNFWWFGYAHYAPIDGLDEHEMIARIGPSALDLSADDLRAMFAGRRGRLKTFLLDQSRMAGIGNAYVHDILFLARLHPLRAVNTLTDAEIDALARAIRDGLQASIARGGASYETDLYGQKGGFTLENDVLIGYKEGQPCPNCGTPIVKIKTGSTSSFICPTCQPEAG